MQIHVGKLIPTVLTNQIGTNKLVTVDSNKPCEQGHRLGLEYLFADHESYIFRHPETIELCTKHLKKTYPQGCKIINIFSSNGEETSTIAISLGDKKFELLGIDFSKEMIEKAKAGEYTISSEPYTYIYEEGNDTIKIIPPDKFLLEPDKKLTEAQKLFKKKFFKYFDVTEKKVNEIKVKVKHNAFNNVKFIEENALNIDIININNIFSNTAQPVGAVVAQNGSYHILKNNKTIGNGKLELSSLYDCDLNNFKKLIQGIYNLLDKDGILVFGSLDRDHLTKEDLIKFENEKFLEQIGENKNRYFSSAIHEILKDVGFEPLHYGVINTPTESINKQGEKLTCYLYKLGIQVPVILKKVKR